MAKSVVLNVLFFRFALVCKLVTMDVILHLLLGTTTFYSASLLYGFLRYGCCHHIPQRCVLVHGEAVLYNLL